MTDISIHTELKEQRRLLELIIQQKSGHDSDMRKSMEDLKKNFDDFKIRVEPMLQSFNETQNKKMVLGKYGIEIKNKALWITAVLTALGLIGASIKFGWKFFTIK